MDVIFLLVPLISGYYFASGWYYTKFKISREDGHRLYFRSAFFALVLTFVAVLLRTGLLCFDFYQQLEFQLFSKLSEYVSNEHTNQQFALLMVSLYTVAISLVILKLFNWCTNRDECLLDAIKDDDFEKLIYTAARKSIPLSATMDNSKVYIGYALETSDPTLDRKAITIFPSVSGYCESNGHKFIPTTYYTKIRKALQEGNIDGSKMNLDDFYIVLPVEKIQSIRMFDFSIYKAFLIEEKNKEKTGPEINGSAKGGGDK